MKSIKTIILASAIVAAGSVVSNAQTRLHYTGSTAYRGATINAIHNIFDGGTPAFAYTGSSETGANAAVYSGTIGGNSYIIKTYWTGSEAGIQAVAQDSVGVALNFVSDTPSKGGPGNDVTPTTTGVSGIDDPTSGVSGDYTSVVPNVDMADTYQATSQFHGSAFGHSYPNLTGASATGNTLGAGIVGVVPFQFVASSHATFSNVTPQLVRATFSNGSLPRALFTGAPADESNFVYATGRDPDSGTRLTAFAETGYGATAAVFQYQPQNGSGALITSTGSTIAQIVPWPDETVNGILVASPNGGYNSGGKLAGGVGSDTSTMVVYDSNGTAVGTGGDLLTYLSTGDATTAAGGGAIKLSYNGVPYSLTATQEGQYTFWGYEHMYYRSLTTAQRATVNSIATSLYTTYATVKVPTMRVKRATDGGTIANTY